MPDLGGISAFSALLRQHRLAAGWTQAMLAERAGIAERTIQDLERGVAVPRRATVRRLVNALALLDEDRSEMEAVTPFPRPTTPRSTPGRRASGTDAGLHNLPIQPTALLGREREVAAIRAILDSDARLVTLTGPGGVGKTRLGLEVGTPLLEDFADGVFLVELAPISDPVLVPSAIAQVVGVRDVGQSPILDALKDFLSGKTLLLILDNFEQVVAAAPIIADVLAASPGVKVLVTSREPLRVRGEREYPVRPLEVPDFRHPRSLGALSRNAAVALFVERAVAVRPDFALTTENAEAVAQICARLDGLPLALELAAARLRLFSSEAMLARLDRRLPLLTGGARDLPTRQRTLRDTIAWSYEQLDDAECRVFRRLAVFVGGFNLKAAEVVCADEGEPEENVLERVESLVAKSLLRAADGPDGELRFAMLETIREYALERLEAGGETATFRQRHAEHLVTLAEQAAPRLTRADGAAWLERLQAEHDNIRAALAWSAEAGTDTDLMARLAGPLWQFWFVRGYFREGRLWLDRALGTTSTPVACINVLHGAGALAFFQDDLARAFKLWARMLALGREHGDRVAVAYALAYLCFVARQRGQYEHAQALGEESVALSRQIGDKESLANALVFLGQVPLGQAHYDRAAQILEECLMVAREADVTHMIAHALCHLARAVCGQGDLGRAEALCGEALELFQLRNDQWGYENCIRVMMRIAQLQDDADRGLSLVQEDLVINRHLGSQGNLATDLECMAWIARAHGQAERAARLLGAADGVRQILERPIQGEMRQQRDTELALARTLLGEKAFTTAWAEGQTMSLEQAVAYALETPAST